MGNEPGPSLLIPLLEKNPGVHPASLHNRNPGSTKGGSTSDPGYPGRSLTPKSTGLGSTSPASQNQGPLGVVSDCSLLGQIAV